MSQYTDPVVSSGSITGWSRTDNLDSGIEVVTPGVCTSTSGGAVVISNIQLDGELVSVVTAPGASVSSYSMTLKDATGRDVMAAAGGSRSTSAVEQFVPLIGNGTGANGLTSPAGTLPVWCSGSHTLTVSGVGTSKTFQLWLYLRKPRVY